MPKGSSKPPTYFEAIVQLRDCDESVADFVIDFVEKQNFPDYFISKALKVKNGVDLYLSSNQLAVKIASVLPKRFGGRVQTSSTLFGRDHQTSKNLMRLTVAYRGLDFKKGDVLALPVKRTVVEVLELGTTVRIRDLKKNKRTGFVPNRTHYRILDVKKTRVATVSPSVQILDPETYQPVELKNEVSVNVNQEVKVVFWLGWWLVK